VVSSIGFCRNILITGRPARSAAMPVLFLLSGPKMGFSPRRGVARRGLGQGTDP